MMDIKTHLEDLKISIDRYSKALDNYDAEEFQKQPDPESWSIGQMYGHLIHGTRNYHFKLLKECLQNPKNLNQPLSEDGIKILEANAFPPIRIKVPTSNNSGYQPPQMTIEEAKAELLKLRVEIESLAVQVNDPGSGRMPHPRFGYLNAGEWLQLIAMHFRHHFLQLNRLHDFLGKKLAV